MLPTQKCSSISMLQSFVYYGDKKRTCIKNQQVFFPFNSVNLCNIWEELAMTETRCPIYYADGTLSCPPEHVKIAAVHTTVAVVTVDACLLHYT